MSCEPAVVEMLGFQSSSAYPFPLGGASSPEAIFCLDGQPVIEPHGTFLIDIVSYGVTLTAGTTNRRWWFSAPATNRANIATISNVTARPLEVVLFVQAGQSFSWDPDHFDGSDPTLDWPREIVPRYDVGVLEGSLSSSPQMTYSPYGTDAAVFQVNPTLTATHYWSKLSQSAAVIAGLDDKNTATQMVFGKLPPLMPDRKYVAEPSIFINSGEGGTISPATGYTAGRMYFALMAWTAFD